MNLYCRLGIYVALAWVVSAYMAHPFAVSDVNVMERELNLCVSAVAGPDGIPHLIPKPKVSAIFVFRNLCGNEVSTNRMPNSFPWNRIDGIPYWSINPFDPCAGTPWIEPDHE